MKAQIQKSIVNITVWFALGIGTLIIAILYLASVPVINTTFNFIFFFFAKYWGILLVIAIALGIFYFGFVQNKK